MLFDAPRVLRMATRTFEIEARALIALAARLDEGFVRAVQAMLACRGRVVVMGMGKSGHVGRKIAATLASTGTPAMFVHPAEASHGDLGMVVPGDVVLAISHRASITAQTAPGDAQAVAFLEARDLREADFLRSHPGGSPGRKLLKPVRDLIRGGDVMDQHRVTSLLVADAQGVRLRALDSNNLMRAKVV